MAWLILFLAGAFEIGWAVGMKYTDHFTRPLPTIATVAAMIASVLLLEYAARSLPLGTAYAVWTGIGAIGTVIFGIILFAEPASVARLLCVALIVIGIVGLHAIPTP
jgi:quaternary ammonium compound-resistance protein SugE